jgi:hypothetical protein
MTLARLRTLVELQKEDKKILSPITIAVFKFEVINCKVDHA